MWLQRNLHGIQEKTEWPRNQDQWRSALFSLFLWPLFLFPSLFSFWSLYWICYTIASVVYVLIFWPQDVWDLSSATRDGTHTLAMEGLTAGLPGKPLSFLFFYSMSYCLLQTLMFDLTQFLIDREWLWRSNKCFMVQCLKEIWQRTLLILQKMFVSSTWCPFMV